jgi:hypothetical protein
VDGSTVASEDLVLETFGFAHSSLQQRWSTATRAVEKIFVFFVVCSASSSRVTYPGLGIQIVLDLGSTS